MTSFDDGGVRKVSGSDWQSAGPTSFSSSSPSTACQRLRSWPSSLLQPSMTMSTQAQPTASTSRPSEQWGMAGAGGAKAARGALYRGLGMTYSFTGRNAPSCTMTDQCWRITTSALFFE